MHDQMIRLMQAAEASTPVSVQASESRKLLSQIADQLAENTRAEKLAACEEVRSACEKEHSKKRKQLENASSQEREKLVKLHEAAMMKACEMMERRKRDSQQFTFTIRGHPTPDLSGSIPRSVFEAEPESVLNRMYNGEWAYAADDQGRACINSDPRNWPLILNWLSFGSITAQPSECFLAECKYWQLDNLLARIQEQQRTIVLNTEQHFLKIVGIGADVRDGVYVKGSILRFAQRYMENESMSTQFEAFGSCWILRIDDTGVFVGLYSGPAVPEVRVDISIGARQHQWQSCKTFSALTGLPDSWGELFPKDKIEELQRPPYVDLLGSLTFDLQMLFENPK